MLKLMVMMFLMATVNDVILMLEVMMMLMVISKCSSYNVQRRSACNPQCLAVERYHHHPIHLPSLSSSTTQSPITIIIIIIHRIQPTQYFTDLLAAFQKEAGMKVSLYELINTTSSSNSYVSITIITTPHHTSPVITFTINTLIGVVSSYQHHQPSPIRLVWQSHHN